MEIASQYHDQLQVLHKILLNELPSFGTIPAINPVAIWEMQRKAHNKTRWKLFCQFGKIQVSG